jgi:hypothetical protein
VEKRRENLLRQDSRDFDSATKSKSPSIPPRESGVLTWNAGAYTMTSEDPLWRTNN